MKQTLILASFLLSTTLATFASNGKTSKELKSKSISITQAFSKVSVGEKLHVIFINDNKNSISVTGTDNFLNDVIITNEKGTLSITSSKYNAKPGVIYISVSDIKDVVLKNEASAVSEGFLDCRDLKVELGDGSRASLKTRGKIELLASDGTQLNIEKFQSIGGD